jgi:hypothetical protein
MTAEVEMTVEEAVAEEAEVVTETVIMEEESAVEEAEIVTAVMIDVVEVEMIGKYHHLILISYIELMTIDEEEVPYRKTEDSVTIVKEETQIEGVEEVIEIEVIEIIEKIEVIEVINLKEEVEEEKVEDHSEVEVVEEKETEIRRVVETIKLIDYQRTQRRHKQFLMNNLQISRKNRVLM